MGAFTCSNQRLFYFPLVGAGSHHILKKRTDNHKWIHLVHYRLCVCASGSWMIDKFSFLTAIRVSCLHLGQYNGNYPVLYHCEFSTAFCFHKRDIKSILSSSYLPLCLVFFFYYRIASWRFFFASLHFRIGHNLFFSYRQFPMKV